MSTQPLLMMQTAAPTGAATAQLFSFFPFIAIFVIFYFLMIRPQQRQAKAHRESIAAVKKGDDVITGGGIRGRVTKVSDEEAEVEVAQNVRIRVVKSTISQVVRPTTSPAND